ncbi:MAG: protoporphyrinogen oxidase [Bacteroidota bacterium]|nr:protoporphyrinogen oxidase [Bacteroidota bacterium]
MHIDYLKTHTVIIGAGITGLSTAHFLSKRSTDFLVIEQGQRVGGNIHSKKIDGFLIENGPNTVLINNPSIQQLIEDCQLQKALLYPSEEAKKNRYVLRNGKLQLVPKSPLEVVSTPILKWNEKMALLKDIFTPKHKYDVSVSSFVNKRFGKAALKHFFVPFLTGIYAGDVNKMSARYTLKKIWNLEQKYGSVIRGLKQQKTNASPRIFNFSEGLSLLTQTLAKNNAKRLKCDVSVKEIKKNEDGYLIISKNYHIHCKRIISAIPAYALSSIINDKQLAKALVSIPYVPVDVFHFGFKKEHVKNQAQGFGVLTKPSDNKHFLGVLFNNRIFPHVCANDQELFTVIVGGGKQGHLCNQTTEALESLILKEVKQLLECDTNPIFTNHTKYQKGIPQYHLNFEDLKKEVINFEKNNANFHILGNYLNGVSVSDCVENADNLVKKLKL